MTLWFSFQGGTLSFSQTTCDAGFRGDVIEICGEDTKCIENSAKFLWFLKSEHTYNYGYLDKCDSGCVRDFIKGLWGIILKGNNIYNGSFFIEPDHRM